MNGFRMFTDPLLHDDVDGFNPFRGNVYTDLKRDANGVVVAERQTRPADRRYCKDIDVANRYNYQKGDYRNYRDGDLQSAIPEGADWTTEDNKRGSQRMYAQDESKPNSTDFVTLINDNARVYKGGSWKRQSILA